jgi:hypothetical protein
MMMIFENVYNRGYLEAKSLFLRKLIYKIILEARFGLISWWR